MSSKVSPTVRRRRLGAELRKLRKDSNVSVDTVAEAFDCTASTVYRMELGRVGVKSRDIELFVELYKVTDDNMIKELKKLAKEGSKRGWWAKYTDSIMPPYATYIGLEADATKLSIYDGLIINGLLQTRDYAEATFDFASDKNKKFMDKRISLRMERQERVAETKDLQVWNVIDEAAMSRIVGGRTVMRAQLNHLLKLAELPNVTIQVLPFEGGAYPGMLSSFVLMEFGSGEDPEEPDPDPDPSYRHPDVVYIEGHTADVYEEEHVEPFQDVFENLRVAALSPTSSLEKIRGMRDRLS
ncbi:MAG TPA: helix-turn-helix transcriptional regulator [Stackebrandtia sp.]|uniref:helix-turn-helix domain-containing protein n=1 Tax=Stackebrandtia sp. TaxID=2023065 RepID=UPI002D39F128|nr:helix-turn-helix transcriptional regulator [Stackebrandtia sp.]HZE37410.1 helix-turn-helix transcriptional regulator [Stackebrandtia sp.]